MICAHIAQFYAGMGGDPPVFYIFDDAMLPAGSEIIETLSDSGDECHREIVGAGNSAIKKAFKDIPPEHFWICEGGHQRHLTQADIAAFKGQYGG